MKRRIKVSVTLDRDEVSPDAIRLALDYLHGQLSWVAAKHGKAINWNTCRIGSRKRKTEQKFFAKAMVL